MRGIGASAMPDPDIEEMPVKYLLDTATCVALIQGRPVAVRMRLQRASRNGGEFFVSALSVFELSRELGSDSGPNGGPLLTAFLAGPISVLPLEEDDARAAAFVGSALEGTRETATDHQVLIAGQALARNCTLVGVGASPLARVKGLACQDWTKT